MKQLQLQTAVIVATALALCPAGCEKSSRSPTLVTIAGAGPQGRWFKEASILGKVLSEHCPDVLANGVIGKGMSVGNIKRIAAHKIDAARFHFFDLDNAVHRRQQFARGEPVPHDYDDVRVWMKLGTHLFRIVATTDIKTYTDLRGKRIAIGGKGTGEETLAQRILAHYGVTADNTSFLYVERTDGQEALANRQIDAIAYAYTRNNRGHFSPIFAARGLGSEVDFVEPDDEKTSAFLRSDPAFFLDTAGEPVFGRPELKGIAFYNGLAVHADVPDVLVYRMTKSLFEHWEEVERSLPWWKEPGEGDLESAPAMRPLPYHSGAVRYYKEAGVWKD